MTDPLGRAARNARARTYLRSMADCLSQLAAQVSYIYLAPILFLSLSLSLFILIYATEEKKLSLLYHVVCYNLSCLFL